MTGSSWLRVERAGKEAGSKSCWVKWAGPTAPQVKWEMPQIHSLGCKETWSRMELHRLMPQLVPGLPLVDS